MSGGGSSNPSGGPIDNQQRLQASPTPSLPPADYSMGYARNFQTPSFFNPFSGYYGANQSYGGGFAQPYGGFGGFGQQFGGFQQPQFGGFGGFGGGFQQPQYGGFQQPQYGGFQQPFSGGFGRQSNRFTRRGQEYTQPYNPQPDYGNMNQFNQPQPQPMSQPQPNPNLGGMQMGPSEVTGVKYVPDEVNNERDRANAIVSRSYRNPGSTTKDEVAFLRDYESRKSPVQVNNNYRPQTDMSGAGMYGGGGGYGGGFNPMMGGLGGFGGFFGY